MGVEQTIPLLFAYSLQSGFTNQRLCRQILPNATILWLTEAIALWRMSSRIVTLPRQ
jgi:hypothetical protein